MTLAMDVAGLTRFLDEVFPQVAEDFVIEDLREHAVRVRLLVRETHLRPGGTVSGPAMFALADVAVYAMVLAMVGRKALAVTTNCSIDFMRKPEAGADLIARGQLLKLGKMLAVGDVHMFSEGAPALVARATLTYAIPPK